uniref:RecF/RecN/SMC N-terminal domain-containing protein n=1 Tax=Oncorhynchus kisutch TaxID=8019 RepID=A0A8C7K0H2_ONCKI
MTAKTSKSITTSKPRGKGSQPRDDSEGELDVLVRVEANSNDQEAPPTNAPAPGEGAEAVDNRGLEEILGSIPPPPPPAMTNEPGAPCLMITHIFNQNVKSCAGEQILCAFHKRFSCIIGPNGSGKSNISDQHKDVQSCTVEVHFQKITDKVTHPTHNIYFSIKKS